MKAYSTLMRTVTTAAVAVSLLSPSNLWAQGKSDQKGKGAKGKPPSSAVIVKRPSGQVVVANGSTPPGQLKKQLGLKSARDVAPGHVKKAVSINDAIGVTRTVLIGNGYQVVRVMPYKGTQIVFYQRPAGTLERLVVVPDGEQVAFRYAPATLLAQILARLGM